MNSLGIPVISNLSVGDNLHDHLATGVQFYFNTSDVSSNIIDAFNPIIITEYYAFKKNQLTSNLLEAIIFVKTKRNENQRDDSPDIQLHMIPGIHFEMT